MDRICRRSKYLVSIMVSNFRQENSGYCLIFHLKSEKWTRDSIILVVKALQNFEVIFLHYLIYSDIWNKFKSPST